MTDAQRPHLLLLPGLLNDSRLWQRQIDDLADLAAISVGDLTVADTITALAAAVLAAVPAPRFALAGLSMGGYVALEIVRQAPERVRALALLDTTARPETSRSREARQALMALAETDFPAVSTTLLPKMVHPSRLDDVSVVETIHAMAASVGKAAYLRQQAAIMHRADSRPFLHEIKCPTLVLCGRQDVVTPVEVHQELVDSIAGSSFTVIDQCGHLSPLGQPQQVTDALKGWLLRIAH
ncbi:MAG: alpha/beta fold hydrolase [bacterium]|jgi:pimeloyl-ACP methyl ester carboxylesterase|nr:alpha/beta fold hydrolase [bacterium]MBK9776102.1 alpha/beta fold hydrolase [bacterium]